MKLGRNDQCSCGSGKKFKNCCQLKGIPSRLQPSQPSETEINRLVILFNAGHFSEVENQAQLIVEQYPNCVQALKLLGISQHLLGKNGLPALRQCVALKPLDALAHNNLGNVLKDLGHFEEAVASYRRALKIKADLAGIHYNLGLTLSEIRQFDSALMSFRKAIALKPDYAEVHNDIGNVLKDLGQLDNALSSYRQALAIKPDYIVARSNMLFVLNYSSNYTPSYSFEQAKLYGQIVTRKVSNRFTTWRCSNRPDRLRVGFVSGDFRSHPVGKFLENILNKFDSDRIELIAYSSHFKEDDLTTRIKPCFTDWKSLTKLSDEAAARLIHSDRVHILFDLSGHTQHNRLPLFAWKPSPVQVSWLGYFATTGVTEMDYLLADNVGVPESIRKQFTETIHYLPDTRLCFTPPQLDLPVAPLPALVNGFITFGCFQNLAKVSDNVLAIWGDIFAAIPNAVLRMQCPQLSEPSLIDHLTKRLQRHEISPSRVALNGIMPYKAYLAAYAEVDIILDTFPYPGGTTTCEALYMGVPTLTLAGNSLLARQGASLLSAAGLKDWVTSSKEEYISKAISLANNISGLSHLRTNLRQNVLSSPLFDGKRFVQNFEVALSEIWEEHLGKLPA